MIPWLQKAMGEIIQVSVSCNYCKNQLPADWKRKSVVSPMMQGMRDSPNCFREKQVHIHNRDQDPKSNLFDCQTTTSTIFKIERPKHVVLK
jgi:hypothetical protein